MLWLENSVSYLGDFTAPKRVHIFNALLSQRIPSNCGYVDDFPTRIEIWILVSRLGMKLPLDSKLLAETLHSFPCTVKIFDLSTVMFLLSDIIIIMTRRRFHTSHFLKELTYQ